MNVISGALHCYFPVIEFNQWQVWVASFLSIPNALLSKNTNGVWIWPSGYQLLLLITESNDCTLTITIDDQWVWHVLIGTTISLFFKISVVHHESIPVGPVSSNLDLKSNCSLNGMFLKYIQLLVLGQCLMFHWSMTRSSWHYIAR